jgi:hypothetical protein
MNPDLSIIIPSIRTANWQGLVEQIGKACGKYTFEVIFVGPEYNHDLDEFKNVKYVRDFGSPNRCQQIGLVMSEGTYVTWLADDILEGPFDIDKFLDSIVNESENTIAVGNYNEGGNIAVGDFSIKHCYNVGSCVSPDWQIFNVAFLRRSFLEKLGGFDCKYQVTCIGHADLAARAQSFGCTIINKNINIGSFGHMPGTSGDHEPIHNTQLNYDQPLFFKSTSDYFDPEVELNNWKKEEAVWKSRY